jgi:PAS domain S-box-containing protein
MFKNLKIRTKILIAFSSIAIVTVGVSGLIGFTIARSALEEESFNKLTAVREMNAIQIEDYFQQLSDQVVTLSEDRMIIDAMRAFDGGLHDIDTTLSIEEAESIDSKLRGYYQDEFLERLIPNLLRETSVSDYLPEETRTRILQYLYLAANPNETGSKHLLDNAGDGNSYSQAHELYHPIIRNFLEKFGYYDIFLVDVGTGGHIAYSVFKEVDYGTSLLDGPYSDTNFAEAYRAARDATDKDFVKLVDFEPYRPSYNAPAAFIASPIYDGDEKIGVLIFQMPVDRINDIMTNKQEWSEVGLGESGETYLVGDDFMIRNQSRFLIEDRENYFKAIDEIGVPLTTLGRIRNLNSTIGLQEVKTAGTESALQGETGTSIFPDYRGVPVLSSFKPLDLPDVNWVIMSEIDEEEAFADVRSLGLRILAGAAGLIVVIIAASVFFSRSITRPLETLTENAGDLASGNMDVEIRVSSRDEIGELAYNFDTMRMSIATLVDGLEDANRFLEEKVAERTQELERATEQISAIVGTAPDAIITIDANQNIILFNPQAEIIFGYSADEVVGQSLTMLMPKDVRTGYQREIDMLQSESAESHHLGAQSGIEGQRKDGTIFPAEVGISKFEFEEEIFFTTFFRDVTERKQMEERIKESEERLNFAVEGSNDGLWDWNILTGQVYYSPRWQTMLGYKPGEIEASIAAWEKIVHPEDQPRVMKITDEHFKGIRPMYEAEYRARSKSGEWQWVLARGKVVDRDDNGEPLRMVGTHVDITERRQMEAKLQENALEAQLMYRSAELAAAAKSVDGALQKVLDAICQLTGWPVGHVYALSDNGQADELYPTDIWYLSDPAAFTEFRRVTEETTFMIGVGLPGRVLESGEVAWIVNVQEDENFPRRNLTPNLVVKGAFGVPVKESGNVVAVLEFFSDQVMEPDENLIGIMTHVAEQLSRVFERRRAAEALLEAADAAQAANRAKSAFLANMSHELRTPMNAIIGYSEMLAEDAEDDGYDEMVPDLEKINAAGRHLLALINDILDLSKIEAGRMDLYLERFDLRQMLDESVSTITPLVAKNDNQLVADFPENLGTIRADLTKVRQALFNLMSNAAKFTEKGTITLAASREQRQDGEWISMSVIDSGIGIPEDKIEHVFEEFGQADESTTRNYGGTGLGLPISQRFCRMMGGDITVESELGVGSTFTIELPAEVKAAAVARATAAAESDELRGITEEEHPVLVIDDDPQAQDLLKRALEGEGYTVIAASSGEQGLELARRLKPSLITLDIMMPDMDGWAVLRALKADPELQEIPVIMISIVGDEQLGYTLGAVQSLTKPVDRQALLQTVRQYASPSGGGRVLIVEDDESTRSLLSRALSDAGWEAAEAENGAVALDLVSEKKPDLILLDLMMPVMDGFEFVFALRQQKENRTIPIIVVTAKDLTEEDRQRLVGGVEHIIDKGAYTQEELLEQLRAYVAQLNRA